MSNHIDSLPKTLADAQREIVELRGILASFREAQARRRADEAKHAATPAVQLEVPVLEATSWLEGVADGSEDVSRPVDVRDKCESVIRLIRTLHESLKAAA